MSLIERSANGGETRPNAIRVKQGCNNPFVYKTLVY